MFVLIKTPAFLRCLKRFLRKHRDLCEEVADVLHLLEQNPFDPKLRLHPLGGDLAGFHAVSVTYSYRITLILRIDEKEVRLIGIGSHDDVY